MSEKILYSKNNDDEYWQKEIYVYPSIKRKTNFCFQQGNFLLQTEIDIEELKQFAENLNEYIREVENA